METNQHCRIWLPKFWEKVPGGPGNCRTPDQGTHCLAVPPQSSLSHHPETHNIFLSVLCCYDVVLALVYEDIL